jgi:hypothetical protein
MAEKLPAGWDNHHTLYYRRFYTNVSLRRSLRTNSLMIVPIDRKKHTELHWNVPPASHLPSEELAGFALGVLSMHQRDNPTSFEAFTNVRDELKLYNRRNRQSRLGKEALLFSNQFSDQLEYMEEVPILGPKPTSWNNKNKRDDELNQL